MHAFLSPGIRLLGHFGFARKFQVLFLLFIVPLMGSLYLIGQDYRSKLALITEERAGVHQLLSIGSLDNLLEAQRDRAARWRATETNRQPTPATQAALAGLDSASMSKVGWWPDGYDRFTSALSALQALREQIAMDSRLILAPWMETYLLTQIATQHAPDLIERVG